MKLIDVEKIDFSEVFNGGTYSAKEAKKKAEKYISEQPIIKGEINTGTIILEISAIIVAFISLVVWVMLLSI